MSQGKINNLFLVVLSILSYKSLLYTLVLSYILSYKSKDVESNSRRQQNGYKLNFKKLTAQLAIDHALVLEPIYQYKCTIVIIERGYTA